MSRWAKHERILCSTPVSFLFGTMTMLVLARVSWPASSDSSHGLRPRIRKRVKLFGSSSIPKSSTSSPCTLAARADATAAVSRRPCSRTILAAPAVS